MQLWKLHHAGFVQVSNSCSFPSVSILLKSPSGHKVLVCNLAHLLFQENSNIRQCWMVDVLVLNVDVASFFPPSISDLHNLENFFFLELYKLYFLAG